LLTKNADLQQNSKTNNVPLAPMTVASEIRNLGMVKDPKAKMLHLNQQFKEKMPQRARTKSKLKGH
jgi:hypothetical protein